jgi:polyisoprenoid-binding protein YceI
MNVKRHWLMTGLFVCISGTLFAESLTIDPARSSAEFSVSNMGFHQVHGRFKTMAGKMEYDAASPTKSIVVATIQAESIDTDNPKRDHHLRSSDFFDVGKYPQISYVSQTIKPEGDHYVMQGALVMKNVLKPVPIIFTFEATKQPNGKTLLKAKGHTTIKREDFGLTYGNGFMIGHDVTIDLTVEAQ